MERLAAAFLAALIAALACDGRVAAEREGTPAHAMINGVLTHTMPAPDSRMMYATVERIDTLRNGSTVLTFASSAPEARLLDNGSVAVLDAYNSELYLVSPDGLASSVNRRGSGPGEFDRVTSVVPSPAGVIAVWDEGRNVVHMFDTVGTFLRDVTTAQLPALDGAPMSRRPQVIAVLDDQRLITRGRWVLPARMAVGVHLLDDSMAVFRTSADGSEHVLLRTALAGRHWRYQTSERTGVIDNAFEPGGYLAVSGNRIYLGDAASGQVDAISTDGVVEERYVLAAMAERLTSAEQSALREWNAGKMKNLEEQARTRTYPASLPAFDRMLVAADSSIWLREYPNPSDSLARMRSRWQVVSRDGEWRGEVSVPRSVDLIEVSETRLVGRAYTADGAVLLDLRLTLGAR